MNRRQFKPLANLGELLYIKGHPYQARIRDGQDFHGEPAYQFVPRHRIEVYGERGMVEGKRLEPDELLFVLQLIGIHQEKAELLAFEYRKDWTLFLAPIPGVPPSMRQLQLFEVEP